MAANYKWHAWTAEKGKSQDEARTEFVEMAIPMLEERGVDTTDPEKAEIERLYEECMAADGQQSLNDHNIK